MEPIATGRFAPKNELTAPLDVSTLLVLRDVQR